MAITIHETAIVDEGAILGDGTRVWHWVHISSGAQIGRGCSFGQNVFVGGRVTIGNNVKVQNNVSIYDGVHLDDDVFCGPSMVFTNVINPRSHVVRKSEYRPTHVGRGATLGANSTVVCGNSIGAFAMVAAGAVITKNVPPYALMIGVPAKRKGWMCECGVTLPLKSPGELTCPACETRYLTTAESCAKI